MEFWGRERELARLNAELETVRRTGQGRMLSVRGRRQSGKSRLLAEFVERAQVPYLFTTAVKNAAPAVQLSTALADLWGARVPLPEAAVAFAAPPASWADLFARLPLALDGPSVVVLDEFPWAAETDHTLEGVLQNAWDRSLEREPVLLVLVGSDLAMMERLTQHDRPLFGRAHEMVVEALSPAETAQAFEDDREPLDLIDVFLATGGYPRLVSEAARFDTATGFVHDQLGDDASPLVVAGQRILSAEFRDADSARVVLEAIGSVEVGHATFSAAVGLLGGDEKTAGAQVTRALAPLQAKRLVAVETPVGSAPGTRIRRYRIVDPYLRFWFRYCAPELAHIEQGRADLARGRFERDFSSWRGRAVEPLVHQALSRLAGREDERFAGVEEVGSWWDRRHAHEYDVAAADRHGRVRWLGSIKWRVGRPMGGRELEELEQARAIVPRADRASLLAVCPAGADGHAGFDAVLGARDVLAAFS